MRLQLAGWLFRYSAQTLHGPPRLTLQRTHYSLLFYFFFFSGCMQMFLYTAQISHGFLSVFSTILLLFFAVYLFYFSLFPFGSVLVYSLFCVQKELRFLNDICVYVFFLISLLYTFFASKRMSFFTFRSLYFHYFEYFFPYRVSKEYKPLYRSFSHFILYSMCVRISYVRM